MSQMINKLFTEIEKIYDANPGLREALDELREKELTAEKMFNKIGYGKIYAGKKIIYYRNRDIDVIFNLNTNDYFIRECNNKTHNEAVWITPDLHEAISKQLEEMRYIS